MKVRFLAGMFALVLSQSAQAAGTLSCTYSGKDVNPSQFDSMPIDELESLSARFQMNKKVIDRFMAPHLDILRSRLSSLASGSEWVNMCKKEKAAVDVVRGLAETDTSTLAGDINMLSTADAKACGLWDNYKRMRGDIDAIGYFCDSVFHYPNDGKRQFAKDAQEWLDKFETRVAVVRLFAVLAESTLAQRKGKTASIHRKSDDPASLPIGSPVEGPGPSRLVNKAG